MPVSSGDNETDWTTDWLDAIRTTSRRRQAMTELQRFDVGTCEVNR
jgi:hypothetical protein